MCVVVFLLCVLHMCDVSILLCPICIGVHTSYELMRLRHPDLGTDFWSDVNHIQLSYNMDRDANHPHEDSQDHQPASSSHHMDLEAHHHLEDSHDHKPASSSHSLDLDVDSLGEHSIDGMDDTWWRQKPLPNNYNMQHEQEVTKLMSTKEIKCTAPEDAGNEQQ